MNKNIKFAFNSLDNNNEWHDKYFYVNTTGEGMLSAEISYEIYKTIPKEWIIIFNSNNNEEFNNIIHIMLNLIET